MKCKFCGYMWSPRREYPKSCPRCKRRFDYPSRKELRSLLLKAKELPRGFERTIHVVSAVTKELEKYNIKLVIIGGAAVEFYTRNWYATGDIDLAVDPSTRKTIADVLKTAGFKKSGRMWTWEELDLYIEMPGDLKQLDLSKVAKVETEVGNAYVIGIEDIIFDRIQAAKHWNSKADEEQAIRIGTVYYGEVDWEYIEKRCVKEGSKDKLEEVKRRIKNERDKTF